MKVMKTTDVFTLHLTTANPAESNLMRGLGYRVPGHWERIIKFIIEDVEGRKYASRRFAA